MTILETRSATGVVRWFAETWRAFLAAVYGPALGTFRAHTGRAAPRPGGYSEAVAIVGRQSGKTRVSAMLAAFEAITAPPEELRRAEGRLAGFREVVVAEAAQ